MRRYVTSNNMQMIECKPLNWQVQKKYARTVGHEVNPEFYTIHVGSLSDMWQASLLPESMILSFTSMHYSNDEVYRFKVESIKEASEMVLKFAKGMDQLENLKNTIYMSSSDY